MPDPITNPQTRDQYVMRSLFQEGLTSSQLEGAATTRAVAKEMIRSGRAPRTRGEQMVLNNFHTMQRIATWKDSPLDAELLFEIHRMVTAGTLDDESAAGRLRRDDERITVQDGITGEIFHDPPLAAELPSRLEAMCKFANEATNPGDVAAGRFMHPAIRAMLLHFWLAYEYPFVDGNGRTARALFYWLMLRQGYWLFEFVSISEILLKAPARYALAFLHAETDGNDATYFLVHQSEIICRAIQSLHEYIDRKAKELRASQERLRNVEGLNHRQMALLDHALRHPGIQYTVEGHQRSNGIVYETARRDLQDLESRGWMTMKRVGRTYTYTAPPNLGDMVQITKVQAKAKILADL